MRAFSVLASLAIVLCSQLAAAECTPIRIGVIDQHRPPYYLGNGSQVPNPPGASIDLLREIAAHVGCSIVVTRLPVLRIRPALEAGTIDGSPIDPGPGDEATFAFPLDKKGNLDGER